MSLKTFLQHVGTWIGNIFSKAGDEIENVILPAAITITNTLKGILEGDSGDIIGKLVGAAGAGLEDKARQVLEAIVPKLQLAQQFKGHDPATILAGIVGLLGSSDAITKSAFYIEFSGMVAQAWADGKVDLGEAATLAKYFYEHFPAKTVHAVPPAPPAPPQTPADGNA